MKLLVAEDDLDCRQVLTTNLRHWGFEVVVARDGVEAWEILAAPDRPPLAIVEWMMPGMDGLELCRRARTATDGPSLYVIVLTTRSRTEDVVAALQAGADDYVTKPFRREELQARVQVGVRTVALQQSLAERVTQLEDASRRVEQWTAVLQENEARLRALVETAKDGIMTFDLDGVVRDFNPAAEEMSGWTRAEAIGRPLAEVLVPERHRGEHARWLGRYRVSGDPTLLYRAFETTAVRRDGTELPIELSVAAIQLADTTLLSAIVRDVTERRRLEVELRYAQKLESVGRLASGIAHEINTPIQFVGDNMRFLADGFASLCDVLGKYRAFRATVAGFVDTALVREVREAERAADLAYLEEEIPKAIEQTLEGVHHVAAIVRAMKEFGHPSLADEKTAADLNRALEGTITVARNELKYVAEVETNFGELPPVPCYLGDLNQVFLNLLVNAAHAIGDVVGTSGAKGRIRVRTVCEGDTVVITIADTGAGIPEEIRPKVFDLFFTTKEIGRGTGQGLSIARTVVMEKHGGTISFESEVGRGTTFKICLPVHGTPAAQDAA